MLYVRTSNFKFLEHKNVKYIIIEINEFLMYKNFEKKCLNILQNECNMVLVKKNGISFLYENRHFKSSTD